MRTLVQVTRVGYDKMVAEPQEEGDKGSLLRQREAEECADDGWKNFAHELLPKMNLTSLKKMLATLKPLAKDAYKAAMAAREGKDAAAAQKGVRALFEHIPRDAILDAYAGATRKFQLPN